MDERAERRIVEKASYVRDEIDDEDVFNFLQEDLDLFYTYLAQVREQVSGLD